MKLELTDEKLLYGSPVRSQKGFLARVFDDTTQHWIDASTLLSTAMNRVDTGQHLIEADTLWDEPRHQWAYILPRHRGLGTNAVFLPDGCAISSDRMRLFNPHTGLVTPLAAPEFGLEIPDANMAVLTDSTVVLRTSSGEFIHRKAGCNGFLPQTDDLTLMQPKWIMPALTPAVAAQPVAKKITQPEISLWKQAQQYQWLLLAMLGPLAAYLMLRRVRFDLAGLWLRKSLTRSDDKDSGAAWSPSSRWIMRGLLYTLAASFIVPMLNSYLTLRQLTSADHCNAQPEACLDQKTGLMAPIASLETNKENGGDTTHIFCRYVGIWSSTRQNLVSRITLNDDGRYIAATYGPGAQTYTGFWVVQGKNMIWRDDKYNPDGPDINPISQESDGKFTLTERNGSQTLFELIEHIKSSKCER